MLKINNSYKSSNFTDKIIRPEYVVLHCICWADDRSLDFLCNNDRDVSAHYYIAETGEIFNLVDDNKRAWHAGRSAWKNSVNLNDNSIGIELGNTGEEFNENGFNDAQYQSLILLLKDILKRYDLNANAVLSHSDIAPERKTDPGPKFAWQKLIQAGVAVEFSGSDINAFGYSKNYEESKVIEAFQRRFLPNNITGKLDETTKEFINSVKQS